MHKVCPSCKETKPLEVFNKQGKYCLVCHRAKNTEWRKANPDKGKLSQRKYIARLAEIEGFKEKRAEYHKGYYADNKQKVIAATLANKEKIRDFIASHKVGKVCERCGFSDHRCFHFHHRNKDEKLMEVSKMWRLGFSLEKVKLEIDKCELLCANCHMIEHSKEY